MATWVVRIGWVVSRASEAAAVTRRRYVTGQRQIQASGFVGDREGVSRVAPQASGPAQSNPMCLLDFPVRSHLNPNASALSAVDVP